MDVSRVVVVLFVVCLVATPTVSGAVVDGPRPVIDELGSAQASFDRNEVQLTVFENGSARWTFHYERTLSNETERQDFESFASEFNSTETQLYTGFKRDSRALVANGAAQTGREMNATGFDRRARVTSSLGNDIGVVEMSFVWTGFAVVNEQRLVVGDVFEGGLYLGEQQSLVFRPAPGLQFDSVSPEGTQSNSTSLAASSSVTWQGEREFTDKRPQAVFVPSTDSSGATGGGGEGGENDGTDSTQTTEVVSTVGSGGAGWLVGGVGLVVIA